MRIPRELRELVYDCVRILGEAIEAIYGPVLYKEIEELRHAMKKVRGASGPSVEAALDRFFKKAAREPLGRLRKKAKAFSLMLELINVCETSYRTYRLAGLKVCQKDRPEKMDLVFTSHPTEARSEEFLFYMDKISGLVLLALSEGIDEVEQEIFFLLTLALRAPIAHNKRPKVTDEAAQIFHTVLSPQIIDEQIKLHSCGISVQFETWSGGDKDGHPLVGPETLRESLQLSRDKLIHYFLFELDVVYMEMSPLKQKGPLSRIENLKRILKSAQRISAKDGAKIATVKKGLKELSLSSPRIEKLERVFDLYPALVLPLEIREDQKLIHLALKRPGLHINQMLEQIKNISQGGSALWYVKSFVISMCQSSEDILAALLLISKKMGGPDLPVVPLFENATGLTNAIDILRGAFERFPLKALHQKKFKGHYEVMLGYSDSAKENGALPGRLMVERAAVLLEEFLLAEKLVPVFFHGSGGSTTRGGGTIKEQLSWLPKSSVVYYKATIQGEMVQRQFHSSLIMRSLINKILVEGREWRAPKRKYSSTLWKFKSSVQDQYISLVNDRDFQEMVKAATPYEYLSYMKIGSRPSKRSGKNIFSVRAIPWALCWTQTRLFLPFWWGLGTAFYELKRREKDELKKDFNDSPLLLSFIKSLGFTFAKIEPGVWDFHLKHSSLSKDQQKRWKQTISRELKRTISFFDFVTGSKDWLWFKPWLSESIYFRSSMIHPLNVIQEIALQKKDYMLLRESVTGISCGMMTTG